MIYAIVPAAGKSSRMGQSKLNLPFRGSTVLECVLDALRLGGCDQILVVLGPQALDLQPLVARSGARVYLMDEDTPDMRSTVEVGLRWLEYQYQPSNTDAWFLAPADQPMLDAEVVAAVRRTYLSQSDKSIVVPTFAGKRGHPVLLSWRHVAGIRSHPAGEGLNTYLRLRTEATRELPVDRPSVLADLDTPEDYRRLQSSAEPSAANADKMMGSDIP